MENISNIRFDACEDIKSVEAHVGLENEGQMLKVPVYLYKICPCRDVIVGVQVFVDGRLYAMKTKEVFTGCHRCCREMRKFYVGEFDFLFTELCEEDVDIRVLAHYIS